MAPGVQAFRFSEIKKGENSGSTIEYHNVVRKMVPAGMWHGEAAKIVLPKGSVVPQGCKGWWRCCRTARWGRVTGLPRAGLPPASDYFRILYFSG